jgi:hypothetical protein
MVDKESGSFLKGRYFVFNPVLNKRILLAGGCN